ncbi:hypothetical protein B0H10DRAFT_2228556 [Mycena sp. CBHHK59/15]|nr:hypothetical protein B0H10DRAFT_2228556 [Mycena sp. CBHHK59/15]
MLRNDGRCTTKQLINYHAYCAIGRDFRPAEPPGTRQLPPFNASTRSQGVLRRGPSSDGQIHSAAGGCQPPVGDDSATPATTSTPPAIESTTTSSISTQQRLRQPKRTPWEKADDIVNLIKKDFRSLGAFLEILFHAR